MTTTKAKPKNVRTGRLEIRLTVAELEEIRKRANDAGLTVSYYVLTAALCYRGQIRFSPEALEIINEIDPCELSGHVSRCVVAVKRDEIRKREIEEAQKNRKPFMQELAGKLAGFGGGNDK